MALYKYWSDYEKPKYWGKAKLCYMDMEIFPVHLKSEEVYENLVVDVEQIFDTSNCEVERPLIIRKKEKK